MITEKMKKKMQKKDLANTFHKQILPIITYKVKYHNVLFPIKCYIDVPKVKEGLVFGRYLKHVCHEVQTLLHLVH